MPSGVSRTHAGLVVLLILSVFLFVGGPESGTARSIKALWNIGHILYFGLLSLMLIRIPAVSSLPPVLQWLLIIAVSLLLGAGIEQLQHGSTRSTDAGDILRDLTGALLVLAFAPGTHAVVHATRWRLMRIAVTLLALPQLQPLVTAVIDESIARYQFPLLSGFETPVEIDRWGGNAGFTVVSDTPFAQGHVMRVEFGTEKYSRIKLNYMPRDWAGFTSLEFSLYNPESDAIQVSCAIYDTAHLRGTGELSDRFSRSIWLKPGWNRIEVDLEDVAASPAGRRMNMTRVRGIGISTYSLPRSRVLYVDDVRLLP